MYTYAGIHTYTDTHSLTRTLSHALSHTHSLTHTLSHALSHTHSPTRTIHSSSPSLVF